MMFSASRIHISAVRQQSKRRSLVQSLSKFSIKARFGYESIRAALLKYQNLNGDMVVPSKFVVPLNDERWSEEIWDMRLGSIVNNIRRGKNNYADKREDLESIGFDFNSQRLIYKYESIRVALLKYQDLNGDMLVPQIFVVLASDERWPKEIWDMRLGSVVNDIRRGRNHVDKREDLESIGFDFNPQRISYGYESIRAALLKYQELNGDMFVRQKFVVPHDDDRWPKEEQGMKLGCVVNNIRRGKNYLADKREDLEGIGFDYTSRRKRYTSRKGKP